MQLVLLPGLDGTGELFKQFSDHLPSTLAPIVCKYPPDAALGYDELQSVVKQCVPKDGAYFILGESFSGPIAIRLASEQSERCKGLLLVNSFLRCPRSLLGRLLPLTPNVLLRNPPSFFLNYIVRQSEPESAAKEKIQAIVKAMDGSLVRSRLESIRRIDVRREAALIRVPVCIIQSRHDSFIPHSTTQKMSSIFSHSEKIEMPGDHFLLQTYPRQSALEIARFCDNVMQHSA